MVGLPSCVRRLRLRRTWLSSPCAPISARSRSIAFPLRSAIVIPAGWASYVSASRS